MTTDVFSHAWLSGLFGDEEMAEILSAERTLSHMVAFEAAYVRALGQVGLANDVQASSAAVAIEKATIEIENLKLGTGKDGVVVPALIREIRASAPSELHAIIHKGLTSQDVIDTSLVLTLKEASRVLATRQLALIQELEGLAAKVSGHRMTGRTRMQAAVEIDVSDRVRSWLSPLKVHADRLEQLTPQLMSCQFGGAAGDRAFWKDKADYVEQALCELLELNVAGESWHSQRGRIAEFASWLALVTGSLGKMGQDIALMAQQGIDEIKIEGGGGSSAMPHKQNPVQAEVLVSLSHYNATQISGIHLSMVHEQERSGAAWTLEWMILPQMLKTTAVAQQTALDLVKSIRKIGDSKGD